MRGRKVVGPPICVDFCPCLNSVAACQIDIFMKLSLPLRPQQGRRRVHTATAGTPPWPSAVACNLATARFATHPPFSPSAPCWRFKRQAQQSAPTAQHRRCRAESREQWVQRTVRAAPFVNATCTTLRVTRCVPALEHGNLSCPRTSPRPRADLALLLPSQLDRCRNRHRLRVHRRHRHHRHHPAAIAQPLSSSPSPSRDRLSALPPSTRMAAAWAAPRLLGWRRRGQRLRHPHSHRHHHRHNRRRHHHLVASYYTHRRR